MQGVQKVLEVLVPEVQKVLEVLVPEVQKVLEVLVPEVQNVLVPRVPGGLPRRSRAPRDEAGAGRGGDRRISQCADITSPRCCC